MNDFNNDDIINRINNSGIYDNIRKNANIRSDMYIREVMDLLNYQLPEYEIMRLLNENSYSNSPVYFSERWKPITDKSAPGVKENLYYISDMGRIISNSKYKKGLHIMQPSVNQFGYLRIGLWTKDEKKIAKSVHRIELIEFCPVEGFQNLQVNHIDGNKLNNCLWNLEWVTGSENILHAFRAGLKQPTCGENNYYAKITNLEAENIGMLLSEEKYTCKEISEIMNCSLDTVYFISKGKTWRNIYNKYNLRNKNNPRQ